MQITKPYRILAAVIGVAMLAFLFWFFSTVVFYILGAAVFAIMGKPMVKAIENIHIKTWQPPRSLAALVALLALMAIVTGLVMTLMPVIIDKINLLANQDSNQITDMLRLPMANIEHLINEKFPQADFSVRDAINARIAPLLNSDFITNTLGAITSMTVEIAMAVFCIAFITFFFLKDENMFSEWITFLFPAKYENNVRRAIDSTTNLLIRYFIGISIESLIKLVLISLPMYFLGFSVSTAVMIGLVSAILNVIPYVGPIIGAIIGFAIAAITPIQGAELLNTMFYMAIIFAAFQLLDNIILQPYIYASSVKAHPLEIFIVILMAGYIAGITGMLFAIPAYTVLRVFAKEFFSNFKVVQRLTDNI